MSSDTAFPPQIVDLFARGDYEPGVIEALDAAFPAPVPAAFTRQDDDGLACVGRTLHDLRGIRFADGEDGNAPAGDSADSSGDDAAAEAALAAAINDANGSSTAAEKVEDLPEWAQKIIRDTRQEAATHRTAAKTAADQAQKDLTEKLSVALGLKPDAATDPKALTEQLTQAQQNARAASIKLAVYQAAGAHQGNPDALLDSNTFLAKVSALDPIAADFGTQVGEAIKAAVAANPSLKTARAAGASTVDNPPGGENGQLTAEQVKKMTPQQIVEAKAKGLLRDYLAS